MVCLFVCLSVVSHIHVLCLNPPTYLDAVKTCNNCKLLLRHGECKQNESFRFWPTYISFCVLIYVSNCTKKSIGAFVCVGHFTQVVWKSSREVGIGRSVSRDGKCFVVANFYPAGNYIGHNAENVLPTRDGKIQLPAKTENATPAVAKPGSYIHSSTCI